MNHHIRLLGLLLTMAVGFSTGCTSWSDWSKTKDFVEWPLSRFAKDYQQPQRIAVIWSADVMTMPGQPATRGFGGRLYFYNEKSIAVPVKGELMIYGYEEPMNGPSVDKKTVPDKKFKFSPEQFAERFSKSDLGASYSIWIPWDEAGGNVKRVSLIPIFKLDNEKVVYGDAAELTLPGRTPESVMVKSQSYPAVNGMINAANGTYQNFSGGPQNGAAGVGVNHLMPKQQNQGFQQQPVQQGLMPNNPVGPATYINPGTNGQTTTLLPGVSSAQYNTQVSYPGGVSPASANMVGSNAGVDMRAVAMQNSNVPPSGLKTTTIQVPSQVAGRFATDPNSYQPANQSVNANGSLTPAMQAMLQMQSMAMNQPNSTQTMPGNGMSGGYPSSNMPAQNAQNEQAQYGPTQYGQGQYGQGQYGQGQYGQSQPQHGFATPDQETMQRTSANAGTNSRSQLRSLPADFGPRKRQALAR